MERQSLNVFCKVFTYLPQMKYNVKDDLWESLDEERMTHVLILYFRYFAQTNLAATILLEVGSCHICRNFIIGGWRWLQPVLFPGQAAPAHLLEEDDDAGDQLGPSLLQLKQSGRRPEQICHWKSRHSLLPFCYLTKTFVLPKVTSVRNFRSSSRTLLTIYFDENFHENLAPD